LWPDEVADAAACGAAVIVPGALRQRREAVDDRAAAARHPLIGGRIVDMRFPVLLEAVGSVVAAGREDRHADIRGRLERHGELIGGLLRPFERPVLRGWGIGPLLAFELGPDPTDR